MDKAHAINLLGGSIHAAAATLKVTYQAVKKWPDPLPERIAARVLAVVAREKLGENFADADAATVVQQSA